MAGNVTDKSFKEKVLEQDGLVIVDFWATWCPPCKALTPIIEQLGEDHADKAKVLKIDVDQNQKTAQKFNVISIPTVKYFKDGEEVESMVGLQPKGVYEALIEKHSK